MRAVVIFRFVALTTLIYGVLLIFNKFCCSFQRHSIDFYFGKYQADITSKRFGYLSSAYEEKYKAFIENVPEKVKILFIKIIQFMIERKYALY